MEKKEMQNKKKKYVNSATMHGLSRMLNGGIMERLFQVIMVLCSLTFVSNGAYQLYTKFQARDVYMESKHVIVEGLALPSVTFCSNDRLPLVYTPGLHSAKDDLNTAFSGNFYNFSKLYKSFCKVGEEFCSIDDFTTEGVKSPCITFNPKGKNFQKLPGSYYGLQITLLKSETYTEEDEESMEGITVVIHDPSYYVAYYFEGFKLSPGVTNSIEIYKTVTKRLPKPYKSNCSNENNIEVRFPGSYNHATCLMACFTQLAYVACGDVFHPRFGRYIPQSMKNKPKPNYTSKETGECIWSVGAKYNSNGQNRCPCPIPCHDTRYTKNIHELSWNVKRCVKQVNKIYKRTFNKLLTETDVRKMFYRIHLFQPRLEYEVNSEIIAYSATQGIADLGQLGLALGASILSVVELMIISLLAICSGWRKKEEMITS